MTDEERLQQLTQDIYLTRFGRLIDDITDTDGVLEVTKTIAWVNMLLDELEGETDWNMVREDDENLGTVSTASQVFELDDEVLRLVVNAERPLVLKQGDSIVSRFEVVDPNQITRRTSDSSIDRVATVGRNLVFSRPFNTDTEIGATVVADTVHYLPRLVQDPVDVSLLDVFKPYNLLTLGAAKNATLPDIVQGGLSPSFVQKYADELAKAVAKNNASSYADEMLYENYGSIGGVY